MRKESGSQEHDLIAIYITEVIESSVAYRLSRLAVRTSKEGSLKEKREKEKRRSAQID